MVTEDRILEILQAHEGILQRLDERTERIDERAERIDHAVFGNGKPGLVADVNVLQAEVSNLKAESTERRVSTWPKWGVIVAVVMGLVGVVAAAVH